MTPDCNEVFIKSLSKKHSKNAKSCTKLKYISMNDNKGQLLKNFEGQSYQVTILVHCTKCWYITIGGQSKNCAYLSLV